MYTHVTEEEGNLSRRSGLTCLLLFFQKRSSTRANKRSTKVWSFITQYTISIWINSYAEFLHYKHVCIAKQIKS